MEKIKNYLKLIRVKHYLKNFLIFIPLLFSGQILDKSELFVGILGFLSFSFIASVVYIINDYKDIEKDRLHPIKKNRPLAAGKVSRVEAIVILMILAILVISINAYLSFVVYYKNFLIAFIFEILYLMLNILYSCGLKNVPIIDVIILVSGYIFRMLFGAQLCDITISQWLYLTVMSGALYMAFGKRRNEFIKQGDTSRKVLSKYNKEFLDKFMYVCLILSIVFYCLWCIDENTISRIGNNYMIWTIPFIIIIFMKYSLNIEQDSYGDPVDVILEDKVLMTLVVVYSFVMFGILYLL